MSFLSLFVQDSLPPGAWNPIPLNFDNALGQIILTKGEVHDFALPEDLPKDTREVLLFVHVNIGWSKPNRPNFLKLFTQVDGRHYSHYLAFHTFEQNAISSNSDNVWLPMGTDRKVYVDVLSKCEHGGGGSVCLIGYR